jgi:hypothetical protein
MHTYTTTLAGGTDYGREWRATSPNILAYRLYGRNAYTVPRVSTGIHGVPDSLRREVYSAVTGAWLDDIFIND